MNSTKVVFILVFCVLFLVVETTSQLIKDSYNRKQGDLLAIK